MKNAQNTKNSHYVPQFYLKNFLGKNNSLHCYDLTKKNYFECSDLKQVCKKRNLYLIKNKISELDKALFIKMFGNSNAEDKDFCNQITEMLNGTLGNLFTIKINSNKEIENEINNLLSSSINIDNYSRKQESLFTFIENDFQILYENIINQKVLPASNFKEQDIKLYLYIKILKYVHQELFNDLKNTIKLDTKNIQHELPKLNLLNNYESIPQIDIMHYMLSQYFRTKKIITGIKNILEGKNTQISTIIERILPNQKFDMNNVMFLFLQIQPILLLNNVIIDNYELILLKNCTYTPFLISDNPCINTYAEINKKNYNKDELEIYFPLTPEIALIITKNKKICREIDDISVVDCYNNKITNNAERFIFSNDIMILKKYNLI